MPTNDLELTVPDLYRYEYNVIGSINVELAISTDLK